MSMQFIYFLSLPLHVLSTCCSSDCHMVFLFLLQMMSAGVGQYPSLYSTPTHSDSGKWDALVKASESLLKEKELIIERQVPQIILLLMCGHYVEGKESLSHCLIIKEINLDPILW